MKTQETQMTDYAQPVARLRRSWLRLLGYVGLLLLSFLMTASFLAPSAVCPDPETSRWENSASPYHAAQPEPPKKHELIVKNPSGNNFLIDVRSPAPPPPSYVNVTWVSPHYMHVKNVQASHPQYQAVQVQISVPLPTCSVAG